MGSYTRNFTPIENWTSHDAVSENEIIIQEIIEVVIAFPGCFSKA